ncbi:MAG: DUF1330 domain-containing protein [Kofleriaceae bacterium]|nr:DUF1330 domain-containing protein [Kofleriaceae bacterium]MCB9572558.1 DUF1330 domain-containing protein [Kofleriaceae bacterium]
MTVVAILTVRAAEAAGFRAYEREAARVMARHGGRIERTVVAPGGGDDATFREVHVVTFPDAAAFAAYRADPDPALAALAPRRAAAVIATELLVGADGPDYHG